MSEPQTPGEPKPIEKSLGELAAQEIYNNRHKTGINKDCYGWDEVAQIINQLEEARRAPAPQPSTAPLCEPSCECDGPRKPSTEEEIALDTAEEIEWTCNRDQPENRQDRRIYAWPRHIGNAVSISDARAICDEHNATVKRTARCVAQPATDETDIARQVARQFHRDMESKGVYIGAENHLTHLIATALARHSIAKDANLAEQRKINDAAHEQLATAYEQNEVLRKELEHERSVAQSWFSKHNILSAQLTKEAK